mmetsp:Transcript_25884/g.80766  ORF Transcript_25884/g.80766 Transcript_25884/m.80766 type:complete len:87 (+) Transcript_25884:390-650(+)
MHNRWMTLNGRDEEWGHAVRICPVDMSTGTDEGSDSLQNPLFTDRPQCIVLLAVIGRSLSSAASTHSCELITGLHQQGVPACSILP